MTLYSPLVIILGYLLGSISWAYIIGQLVGKIDLRDEGVGSISPSTLYHRLGLLPTMIAGFLDFSMGAVTIIIAKAVGEPLAVTLISGLAAMVGHNWSIFLKFKGGEGASIIQGVLCALVFWQFVVGGIVALIVNRLTRKTGLSTIVWVVVVAITLLVQNLFFAKSHSVILVLYPLILTIPMFLKKLQIRQTEVTDTLRS